MHFIQTSFSASTANQIRKPLHATSSEHAAVDELCHVLARVIMRLNGTQQPEVTVDDGGVQ